MHRLRVRPAHRLISPFARNCSRWIATLVLAALVVAALAWLAEPMTAQAQAAPSAPTGFDATAGIGEVALAWDDPADGTITGYQYQQKEGSGSFGGWIDIPDSASGGANAASYTVTGLTPGTAYTFKLRAVYDLGEGAESGEASATPAIGGAWSYETVLTPSTIAAGDGVGARMTFRAKFQADQGSLTSLSVRITSGAAIGLDLHGEDENIGWTTDAGPFDDSILFDSSSGVIAPVSGSRCRANEAAGSIVCEARFADRFYANCTATPGNYTVEIWVYDAFTYTAVVNGLESTRSRPNDADFPDTTLTVLPAPPLPNAPAGFGATAGAGEVTLRWDDPRDFSITKYQYQQKAGSGSFGGWNDIADSGAVRGANATSYTVTGLDNGVAYTFKIRAVNSGGEGAESSEASATPGIGGAWSFAIKLEPDPITAGGTTGADVTVVATFTADQQSLLSLSATAGGNGDLTAFVPQDSATLVGFGDSFDDAIGLANFVLFEDQPDCVPDLSAGILTCTYEISDTNDQLIYAKATATPGPYTIGVSPNIETATITASVNGVTSTMATITGTTIPDVTLTVLAASNTAPSFGEGGTAARAVDENAAAGANVGGTVTATDADSTDTLTYGLSGTDAVSFDIGADTGQITLGSGTTLDFESKSSYTVTVSVHDGKEAGGNADTSVDDTIAMTINVIDVDEGGSVFLSSEQPRAGTELTATLQDDDAGVTNTTWQWARSADGSTNWGDIASATSASYTPVDGDVDNYLRATATYDDTHGNGKSAQAVSVNRVLPAVPPAQPDGFGATAGVAHVTLAWTDPNDPSITNYQYQQRKGSGSYGQWLDIPGSGPTTASHTVTGLTVGAGYTFRIRAVNGVGAGAESVEAGVTLAAILAGTTELWSAGLTVAESSDAAFGGYRRGGHGTLSSTTFTYESATYTVSVLNRERETADNLLRVAFEPAIPDGLIINRLVLRVGDTYFNSEESDIATGDAPASNIAIWPTSAVAFAPGTWDVGTEVGVALYEIPLTLTLSTDSTTVSEDPPDPLPNNAPTNPGQNVKVTVTVLPEPQVGVRYTGCGLRAADSTTTPYTAGTADYSIPAATKAIRDTDTPTWTKSFNFWIIDDQEFDPGETLVIEAYCTGVSTIAPPKAAADLLTTQLTFTITDNELVAPVVNSQPAFDGGDSISRTIAENADAGANVGAAVAATDSEDDVLTYSISGADAGSFTIDGTNGQLKTSAALDHETKPSYTVTVSVHDGANAAGEVDTAADDTITVTINVTNVEEAGMVSLSPAQPQVGTALNATLTDPDGGISDVSWQWASSSDWDATAETGTWSVTTGADSESYTPVDGDVDNYLRATASYTDPEGSGKSAQTVSVNRVQAAPVVNTAPDFGAETTTRSIAENAAAGADIGAAVTATDGQDDTLTYSISGADAGSFTIDAGTGQITVGSGTSLDYESRNSYAVVVTAADPSGATDTIAVTINVTDVDEPPDVSGQTAVDYAENGAASVATYTASDPEGQTGISWTLAGDDSGDFSITEGVLSFNASPNFESAADANTDNAYLIMVQASDGTVTGALEVTITVTNVEEAGVVSLSPAQPQVGRRSTPP